MANGDVLALKNAITASNTNNEDDIIFLAPGGTYTLTAVDNLTSGPNGLPVLLKDGNGRKLTINGNGATILRSASPGTPPFRIFFVANYPSQPAEILNVSLQNGAVVDTGNIGESSGGTIYLDDSRLTLENCSIRDSFAGRGGGAILSGGISKLTLINCTLRNNEAYEIGGAIRNVGQLTLSGCTLSDNQAVLGPGGALHNFAGGGSDALVTLTSCTITGNVSVNAGGDGIFNNGLTGFAGQPADAARVDLVNCTLDGNGILNSYIWTGGPPSEARLTLRNTILNNSPLTNNSNAGNPYTTITSNGYNLSSDNGGGFLTATGDQINMDPKLDFAGLASNGGPTQTIALTNGSPAIDKGHSSGVSLDQRSFTRPIDIAAVPNASGGDGSDIGAFESQADPVQSGYPSSVVTTVDDHNDGICGGTDCTLREAIARANGLGGANAITFSPVVAGTITLAPAVGGQLTITDSVAITGPGARLLNINANAQTRAFLVAGGNSTISGLTISNGWVAGQQGASVEGGGVYNSATLTLSDCTLAESRATGGSGVDSNGLRNGGAGRGGAIFNAGSLTLNRCTFKNNGATGGFGADNPPDDSFEITTGGNGGSAHGGAVFNDTGRDLTIYNCTFVANNAGAAPGGGGRHGGNGGSGLGGGVYNLGMLNVYASTFSGNTGFGGSGGAPMGGFSGTPGIGAGGLAAAGGTSTLRNTISAGNSASGTFRYDISGVFNSAGYNLIGRTEGGSGFTATGDQTGSNAAPLNAQLAPLADNGGLTDTMRLLSNSPAVDKGHKFVLTTDQRLRGRPSDNPAIPSANGGDGSDIGAYEVGGFLVVTTLDDHSDGTCNASDCTLREAILVADEQTAEESVITFASGLSGIIQLVSSLPQLATNMSIVGPGAGLLTVRRNNTFDYRIFLIGNNTSSGPTVTISGLTVANGRTSNDSGAGILNSYSTLTISNCVITSNSATGFGGRGGGISNNYGTLFINNTTVSGNSGFYGGGIANFRDNPGVAGVNVTNGTLSGNTATGGDGGALYNASTNSGSSAQLLLSNCTLSGNAASGAFGGSGGALSNTGTTSGSATVVLTNCTLSGNNASNVGGGIHNLNSGGGAFVIMGGTILKTGSSGANLANTGGAISSQGYNLSNDSGSGFLTGTGDQINIDPLLGVLTNNGGPTQTHMLLRNSPALDRGNSFGFATDQRGLARIANTAHLPDAAGGDGADIGAIEINPTGGSLADADGDGMADEWEIFYGVDDPNGDSDGDGDNNLKEYLNGTNPTNNSSFLLRLIAIARNGNDIVITFNGVANKVFRLDRKEPITQTSWTDLGIQVTPDTTGNAQIAHPGGASLGSGIYRVRLIP